MRGLSSRALQPRAGSLLAKPVWEAVRPVVHPTAFAEQHILSLETDSQKTIAQRYTDDALACFEQIQTIFKSKPNGKVFVQIVVRNDQEQVLQAGLSGLLKTAALENPQFAGLGNRLGIEQRFLQEKDIETVSA